MTDEIKKFTEVDSSAIILPSAQFRFDVPRKSQEKCVFIGKDCMIGCNFIFESSDGGKISIGERTWINSATNLISRKAITIGNDVTIAWSCWVYDHDSHSLDWEERRTDILMQLEDYRNTGNVVLNKRWDVVPAKEIIIEDKVWIGFDVVILKGVRIGEGAIVGARSVVRRDVAPWTVVAGNPAVEIKKLRPKK